MTMKFVYPTLAYKTAAEEYIREFYEYGSNINGSGSLDRYLRDRSYEEWLEKLAAQLDIANIEPGKVPSVTYFYVRETDERIVGMINIRLSLNDFLRRECGHIGYSIRPTERRKYYATEMLRSALEICKKVNIDEVILTCDRENPASAGVIKNCGGRLTDEFYSETFDETIQRYIIDNR